MALHQLLFDAFALVTCIYALSRGGVPERGMACCFVAALLLTNWLRTPHARFFLAVEWRVMIIDAAVAGIMLVLALWSTRYWTIPMASMGLLDLLGHVARMLEPGIVPGAYFVLVAMIAWPEVLLLLVATRRHRGRLRRHAHDPAWVWQLPPDYRGGTA